MNEYDYIYEELQNRVDEGDLTLEEAEELNEMMYEKYVGGPEVDGVDMYDAMFESIQERYENGEITEEDAIALNELAYERYNMGDQIDAGLNKVFSDINAIDADRDKKLKEIDAEYDQRMKDIRRSSDINQMMNGFNKLSKWKTEKTAQINVEYAKALQAYKSSLK